MKRRNVLVSGIILAVLNAFVVNTAVYSMPQLPDTLKALRQPPLPDTTRVVQDLLKEVVVTATSVSRENDRYIVRVIDSKALSGADGTEILKQAPGVWMDHAGISVNGAGGTRVYVNDREVKLSGENLISYLRTIQSADISKIEVIPQAGAEYSADSKGGIIRIHLRRQIRNGLYGALQFATAQGELLSNYAPSGNLYARAGKWSLHASASGSFSAKNRGEYVNGREYADLSAEFNGLSGMNNRKNGGSGRAGMIYDVNSRHSIGGEIEYSPDKFTVPSDAFTTISQDGAQISSRSHYLQQRVKKNLSATFNYVWKIDTLGSSLKFIADYTRQRMSGDNMYNTHMESIGWEHDSLWRSNSRSRYTIFTGEVAFKKVLSERFTVSAGSKFTGNRMYDATVYEGISDFKQDYTEKIGAVYAIFAANIKQWNFSAGMRGEYTFLKGKNNEVERSYGRLFPNVSVSYAFNTLRTWMLVAQYSNHIERPGFSALNPARIQHSDYSYYIGNPMLRPTFIHRVSATLVFKYRYTFTVGANLHHDLIREVSKTDPVHEDVIYITPENHFTENHYFVAVSAPVVFTKWWSVNFNFVGVKQDIRYLKESNLMSHYLMFANVVSGFTLPAGFYAELSYSGTSRLYSGNSGVEPRHTLNAALKKSILEDKITFSLSAQNITNSKTGYFSITDHYTNTMRGLDGWGSRYFKLSVTYNFRSGELFKGRKLESSAKEERARMTQPLKE